MSLPFLSMDSWSGRAHSRHQDALPLRIPTMISDICSLVIPRTRFRAVAAQKAEGGNATPADRNVQPSPLTSFQQLRGRVVQHWHSAEKYVNNRYTSAQNSTRQSTSPISDSPLPLLSTCFSLFLPSGSTARGIAKAIAARTAQREDLSTDTTAWTTSTYSSTCV